MKWLQLMLGAMLSNGLALVGLKVLAEAGLSERYQNQYLFAWYASGLIVGALYSLKGFAVPSPREIGIGGAMSLMSFTGQVCLSMALTGGALARLEQMTPPGMKAVIHLSLTDVHPYAQAFVIIEAVAG